MGITFLGDDIVACKLTFPNLQLIIILWYQKRSRNTEAIFLMCDPQNIGLSSPTEDVSAFLHSRMMHAIDGLESRAISEAANAMSRADVSIRNLDDWWSQYDSLMEHYKQSRTVHICSNRPLLESTLDEVKQKIALVR